MSRLVQNDHVCVIGAGVAGLTVAHELAERGFRVFVYDTAEDVRRPGMPAIGGMARTQWARVLLERPTGGRRDDYGKKMIPAIEPPIFQDMSPASAKLPDSHVAPWPELYFAEKSVDLDEAPLDEEGATLPSPGKRLEGIACEVARYLCRLSEAIGGVPEFKALLGQDGTQAVDHILVDTAYSETEDAHVGRSRARETVIRLRKALLDALPTDDQAGTPYWTITELSDEPGAMEPTVYYNDATASYAIAILRRGRAVNFHLGDRVRHPWQQRYVRIALRPKILPGEHGYRLFPGFYRHLLDTMQRTPILAPRPMTPRELAEAHWNAQGRRTVDDIRYEPTGRSTFDNLIAVTRHDFAPGDGRPPRSLPRFRTESVSDLFDTLDMLQRNQGWSNQDLMLAQLKFLQYASSSKERRRSYEDISWWDFMGLAEQGQSPFSECFRESMRRWPQALIGLRANEVDARTFGSTALQQFLDQLRPIGYRDGTLNGPTTPAWLDHWQRYLESLGVTFQRGHLEELTLEEIDGTIYVAPKLAANSPPIATPTGPSAYVVLALPVEKTWDVAVRFSQKIEHSEAAREAWSRSDFPAVIEMLGTGGASPTPFDLKWLSTAELDGPLQHFAGIQYFLEEDYRFLDGHVYYPKSAWGLTSISQGCFRHDQADARFNYRGVISVVIGAWDKPGTETHKKTAWACDDQELAEECWLQLAAGYGKQKPPPPRWYHVDYSVRRPVGSTTRRNDSPYLTTAPGRYPDWPGTVDDYRVQFGNLVLAGSFMKTKTRLVTMESANESGRHAANAILRAHAASPRNDVFVGVGPELWDPEDHELRDLDYLKRLDARLHEEGLPHAFDILRLEELIAAGQREGRPATILEALALVAASQGRALGAFVEALRRVLPY